MEKGILLFMVAELRHRSELRHTLGGSVLWCEFRGQSCVDPLLLFGVRVRESVGIFLAPP